MDHKKEMILFTRKYYHYLLGGFFVLYILFPSNSVQIETNDTSIDEISIVTIQVKGAVVSPGIYELNSDDRVADAIVAAGGYLNANDDCLNEAKLLIDGSVINVLDGETDCNSGGDSEVVDINSAEAHLLSTLTGIGESKANAIINYREEHGAFLNIEEIQNVSGIGEATFNNIKDDITV